MRLLFVCWLLGAAGLARADIAPPGQAECNGKKPGDKCTVDGVAGQCQASKCTRPDYSKGPPPSYREVDCVLCRPTKKTSREAAPVLAAAVGLVLLGGALALGRRRNARRRDPR
jgi:LPXTG-motif cell wall-anchored protein